MEQFYILNKPEREVAILKKLIYCIQCDIDSLEGTDSEINEES